MVQRAFGEASACARKHDFSSQACHAGRNTVRIIGLVSQHLVGTLGGGQPGGLSTTRKGLSSAPASTGILMLSPPQPRPMASPLT